jgi:hypothetical protein
VLFQPHRFDTATGKRPWESSLISVTGFEAVDRDPSVLAGGMRKRLGIQTPGEVEIFVIDDLEEKLIELREIVPRP